MIVYVLTDYPYHDNETIHGVFETLEQAMECARKCLPTDWNVTEVKVGEFSVNGWGGEANVCCCEGKERNVP